ncbi:hypothetical protein PROFUN_08615 [Planoprotostelium fungivorum]|uniref:Androgen-induced gene 1 protein n=1 Tax=Planoprotostelium fungivorum TaxID=1890364 RepID=A0A2P6NJ82_9EUKA|nr:hypothetical protein PROFUN_08615 [Planoprotostelium fungivorum]
MPVSIAKNTALPAKNSVARQGYVYATFHALAFAINYYFSTYYLKQYNVKLPFDAQYGGSWRFLTMINLDAQTYYHLFALLVQVYIISTIWENSMVKLKPNQKKKKVPYTEELLWIVDRWYIAVVTLSSIVGVLFWSIFLIDRELIFPAEFADIFPATLNMWYHGGVAIVAWAELGLVPHRASTKWDTIVISTVAVLYIGFTYHAYTVIGSWQYPFLNDLSLTASLGFYFVALLLAYVFGYGSRRIVEHTFHRKLTRASAKAQ